MKDVVEIHFAKKSKCGKIQVQKEGGGCYE